MNPNHLWERLRFVGRRIGSIIAVAALLLAVSTAAWADGARDLGDGIAFYENLDLERARPRLVAATQAPDLDVASRARAFMYIGLLEFELGNRAEAEAAWTSAFQLHHEAKVPDGTSPKTITALEAVRARTKALPPPPPPPVVTIKPAPPAVTNPEPPPPVEPSVQPPPPALVAPVSPEEDVGSSAGIWIGVGAGALAVAGAVVLGVSLARADDAECPRGGGAGCLTVDLR